MTDLIIWTDCDQEGEHIGFEIINICLPVSPRARVRRAHFSAVSPRYTHFYFSDTMLLKFYAGTCIEPWQH